MKRLPELIIGFLGCGLSIVLSFFSWGCLTDGMWLFVAGVISLLALIFVAAGRYIRVAGIVVLACGAVILIILNSILSGLLLVIAGIMLLIRKGDKKKKNDVEEK